MAGCCCGMGDTPTMRQKCFPRGMDMGFHCAKPEVWCEGCPKTGFDTVVWVCPKCPWQVQAHIDFAAEVEAAADVHEAEHR